VIPASTRSALSITSPARAVKARAQTLLRALRWGPGRTALKLKDAERLGYPDAQSVGTERHTPTPECPSIRENRQRQTHTGDCYELLCAALQLATVNWKRCVLKRCEFLRRGGLRICRRLPTRCRSSIKHADQDSIRPNHIRRVTGTSRRFVLRCTAIYFMVE
jgi:hypothetical protein